MNDTHVPTAEQGSDPLRELSDLFLVLSFSLVSFQVVRDIQWGGDPWKQGDWLINSVNVDIRRGQFGSALIHVSDLTGLNLLTLVAGVQIATLIVLYVSFRLLLDRVDNSLVAILLAVAPASFPVFWLADPAGSVRKEVLTFAGLAICALALAAKSRVGFWTGVFLLCVSFLAHEAMVLFLPSFFVLLLLARDEQNRVHVLASSVLVGVFAAYSLIYSVAYHRAQDVNAICRPLLDRGLNGSICGGAIAWLAHDSSYGFQRFSPMFDFESVTAFVIVYALAILPCVYILTRTERPVAATTIFLSFVLPYVPLYFVGVDWGRWMSFHIFSVTILIAAAIALKRLRIVKGITSPAFVILILIALLFSPKHMVGIRTGNVSRALISTVVP